MNLNFAHFIRVNKFFSLSVKFIKKNLLPKWPQLSRKSNCFYCLVSFLIYYYFCFMNFYIQIIIFWTSSHPLASYQYQHILKHTYKLESGSHGETSSLVHIYPLFFTYLLHLYMIIILLTFQFVSSSASCTPSTSVPLS